MCGKSSISSVYSNIVAKYEWSKINGPEDVIHALFRYSCNDGIYPILYHFASTYNALQNSTHCKILRHKL
jgi:hypothetical protein